MPATTSWRSPFGLARSMARPRLTWSGLTRVGLPSLTAKELFIVGMALMACTIAYPMRCVKEIFPPRARLRWLLMTMRLSKSSFTGTARTEVAVGSSREAFMFFATAADGPRSGTYSGPAAGAAAGAAAGLATGAAGAAGGRGGRGLRGGLRSRGGRCGSAQGCRPGPARPGRYSQVPGRWRCPQPPRRRHQSSRWPRRPACSRRRSPTRRGPLSSGPGGTADRSHRRATHWHRTKRQGFCPGLLGRSEVHRPPVGWGARITGGLWRHGGNRPLPLHMVIGQRE